MILEFILLLFQCSSISIAFKRGDKCDGGVCELVSKCPTALENIEHRIYPKICGFEGLSLEPNVCCPDYEYEEKDHGQSDLKINFPDNKHGVPLYKKMCREYALKACNGLLMSTFDESQPKNYPFMALIGYGDGNYSDIKWKCSGTIISEYYILSAARCSHSVHGSAKWVRLGTDKYIKDFEISKHIVHPGYSSPLLENDVMLFKLSEKIPLGYHMHPICLDGNQDIRESELLMTASLGITHCPLFDCHLHSNIESKKGQILISEPKKINHSKCKTLFGSHEETAMGFEEKSTICTQYIEPRSDICQGDFGDSLFYRNKEDGCPSIYNQVGILSVVGHWPYEYGCYFLNTSIIYNKISHHLPWIENIVWKSQ